MNNSSFLFLVLENNRVSLYFNRVAMIIESPLLLLGNNTLEFFLVEFWTVDLCLCFPMLSSKD